MKVPGTEMKDKDLLIFIRKLPVRLTALPSLNKVNKTPKILFHQPFLGEIMAFFIFENVGTIPKETSDKWVPVPVNVDIKPHTTFLEPVPVLLKTFSFPPVFRIHDGLIQNGSVESYYQYWITDPAPDPVIFFGDVQDANKK
jgi:hypothetical protein